VSLPLRQHRQPPCRPDGTSAQDLDVGADDQSWASVGRVQSDGPNQSAPIDEHVLATEDATKGRDRHDRDPRAVDG